MTWFTKLAKRPMLLMVLVIAMMFALFGGALVAIRLTTGHWPVQSKSTTTEEKW